MGSGDYGTIGYDKTLGGIMDKAHWHEDHMFEVSWIGRDIAIPRYRIESGGLANLEHLAPINDGCVSRHSLGEYDFYDAWMVISDAIKRSWEWRILVF